MIHQLDLRHLVGRRHDVVGEAAGQKLALAVVAELLVERGADAVGGTAEHHAADDVGHHIAAAGDVNNDAFDDLLIVARDQSYWTLDGGAVFLHLGGFNGINEIPSWSFFGDSGQEKGLDRAETIGDIEEFNHLLNGK